MSATDRQNRLLVAEDWKRVYQSFRNADFQSYDFENLRRVMINYIRENYPEDFNDYIESSEYLALVDLIAFLGQSLAFRVDLNSRDNFLELAERRESVLRLARLLSYNAKRNIPASGLLKFTTVSTTQVIYDSNGRNLSGQQVSWNDSTNTNWYDQFIKVINAALPITRQFGTPIDEAEIYGIRTEGYRFQASNAGLPIYGFEKYIDGNYLPFEIVSTVFKGREEIYEEPPALGNRLAFIYRNDGKGNGSQNTGFYLHFKQGTLSQGSFNISQSKPNETIDIDVEDINNSDVWLYKLDQSGIESEYWSKVPTTEGNNVIYNSLKKSIRNIYSVVTRTSDKISLVFSDGIFGNLPLGNFRVYYRTSAGKSYTINPKDIRDIIIEIPYISNVGRSEVITISLSLVTSVSNSSSTESSENIKARAPATYYTQNRMITGEDYNLSPLSVSQEITKIKAINRSSSGISRHFDLIDPTGKYSRTNLFGDDGIFYREEYLDNFRFSYNTTTDIQSVIYNQLLDFMKNVPLRDFYYNYFIQADTSRGFSWVQQTNDYNQCTGFIQNSLGDPQKIGIYSQDSRYKLKYITVGSILEFKAPLIQRTPTVPLDPEDPTTYVQTFFDKNDNNKIKDPRTSVRGLNTSEELWTQVISISGDGTANGTGILSTGYGPVALNEPIPGDSASGFPVLSTVVPAWRATLDDDTISKMVDLIFANKVFGLGYSIETRTWEIIFDNEINPDLTEPFSFTPSASNPKRRDWLILFTTDAEFYTVNVRMLRYVFESKQQIRFYFDSSDKIYDTKVNTVIKDQIKFLSINSQPDSTDPATYDHFMEIVEEYQGQDGIVDNRKIQVSFNDHDADGIVDDPNTFIEIVNPSVNSLEKYIVLERYVTAQGQEDYRWVSNSDHKVLFFAKKLDIPDINDYANGQHFYFEEEKILYKLNPVGPSWEPSLDYKVFAGRPNLRFQYIHNANYESRIDPGLTNLIDVYVLTKGYDKSFREWLTTATTSEPLPPSSDFLYNLLSPELNKIKSISDEVIYHPARYKVLFGDTATMDVRATFKVVKNTEIVISDNDVKSQVLSAINEFFNIDYWDFGDNFYFTELSAYVMNKLAPNIVNFIIVPKQSNLTFGSLFEIQAKPDQIFISGATVDNIEIIDTITASKIKSSGSIITTSTVISQQAVTSTGIV